MTPSGPLSPSVRSPQERATDPGDALLAALLEELAAAKRAGLGAGRRAGRRAAPRAGRRDPLALGDRLGGRGDGPDSVDARVGRPSTAARLAPPTDGRRRP